MATTAPARVTGERGTLTSALNRAPPPAKTDDGTLAQRNRPAPPRKAWAETCSRNGAGPKWRTDGELLWVTYRAPKCVQRPSASRCDAVAKHTEREES